jgi:hypothetical protein
MDLIVMKDVRGAHEEDIKVLKIPEELVKKT